MTVARWLQWLQIKALFGRMLPVAVYMHVFSESYSFVPVLINYPEGSHEEKYETKLYPETDISADNSVKAVLRCHGHKISSSMSPSIYKM